jgi:uncharacterized membrane protein
MFIILSSGFLFWKIQTHGKEYSECLRSLHQLTLHHICVHTFPFFAQYVHMFICMRCVTFYTQVHTLLLSHLRISWHFSVLNLDWYSLNLSHPSLDLAFNCQPSLLGSVTSALFSCLFSAWPLGVATQPPWIQGKQGLLLRTKGLCPRKRKQKYYSSSFFWDI